jgi:hypothetical protein
MPRSTLAAALLLIVLSYPARAKSPTEHEAPHAQQTEAAQPAPPARQSGTGQGSMGQGKASTDIMNMMGMGMMGMGLQSGCSMDGMDTIDHIEGRIAFLRAELKITDAQSATWNAVADALRNNARKLGELRAPTMSQVGAAPQGLVDRLTLQEKWLAARLEGTREIKSVLTNLVGTLSDDQKKMADELMMPHISMNAMMCAMRSVRASHHEGMGRMMGQDWDHRKAGREWRMHGEDDEDSGYHQENDQSRRRGKICIEDENGDQYCRHRH